MDNKTMRAKFIVILLYVSVCMAETDEADQVIKNPLMRAATGSLSDLSFNSQWNYQAGSVRRPANAERPNLTSAGDAPLLHTLDANLGINYRLSTLQRLRLNMGLTSMAPFHGSHKASTAEIQREFDNNAGKIEVNDINLSFIQLLNIWNIQTVLTTSAIKFEREFLIDRGYQYAFFSELNMMYQAKNSKFFWGVLSYIQINTFAKDKSTPHPTNIETSLGQKQARMTFSIKPQVEYLINHIFNLRMTVRPFWYDRFRDNRASNLTHRTLSSSVGLGISVTRDIFFTVSMEYLPEDIRSDYTTIAISSRVNLF